MGGGGGLAAGHLGGHSPGRRSPRVRGRARWPAPLLWATLIALAAVGVRLLRAAARRGLTPARLLVLAAVAALFVGLVWSLRDNPEEALHSVQYAVLGALLFRALDRHPGGLAGYAAAAMAGIGLGIIDELIQWLVPGRTLITATWASTA